MSEKSSAERGRCTVCGAEFCCVSERTAFAEAGEWLAEDYWGDGGTLCSCCLENRGMLAMMYLHERNQ
jgi:hypothetical protein